MIIQKSENQDIEFKQSWQDEYLKWICAFANTKGGILYIGVNDKGTVTGVQDFHKLSETIPLKITQSMGLLCDVSVTDDSDNNLKYLIIKVNKYENPVSYHGKYYKRVGSTTQEVTGFELNDLILNAYGLSWDAVSIPDVSVKNLDERAFKVFKTWAIRTNRFKEEELEISNEALLQNLRAFDKERLTRAAVMAFHPDPEKWVIGAYTKIGYFANDADILFQDEIHGSLMTQVEDALDIIYTKYMKALISYPDEIHRAETYFFPRGAFRELLLNALIHKDYTKPYPIQILIYKDKIDIWNIGEMPETVKIEDLYKLHHSAPRNPKIADIFFKCGFIESWGRGYFKIKTICEDQNATLPEPKVVSGGFSAICNASETYKKLAAEYGIDGFAESAQKMPSNCPEVAQKLPRSCPEVAQKTYEAICKNPKSSISELSNETGLSERTIKNHQKLLKDLNIIERVGSDRNGYWKLLSTI